MELELRIRDIVYTPNIIDGIRHVVLSWERGKDYSWEGKEPQFYILFDQNPRDSGVGMNNILFTPEEKAKSKEIKDELIKNLQEKIKYVNYFEAERLAGIIDLLRDHDICKAKK